MFMILRLVDENIFCERSFLFTVDIIRVASRKQNTLYIAKNNLRTMIVLSLIV